jgi:nitroreductase
MRKVLHHALDFRELPPADMQARARDFLALMRRRRTVRDFSDREVPRELIEQAVQTAGTAPSGANQQPWTFAVIARGELRRRLREAAEAEERAFYAGGAGDEWLDALAHLGTDANKPFLETAPWLIAVFAQRWGTGPDGKRVSHYYVPESVGIACGLLIAALHNAGLATLTHTPAPLTFLNELCGRPRSEKPIMLVVAGYPAPDCQVPVIDKKRLEDIAVFL